MDDGERDDEHLVDPRDSDEGADEEPQPWAKLSSGSTELELEDDEE